MIRSRFGVSAVLPLLLAAAASGGCSKGTADPAASKSASLRPTVSQPFDIEGPDLVPADLTGRLNQSVSFACGTSQCLAVYGISLSSGLVPLFRRIGAQGAILDTVPKRLPAQMSILGSRGDEFLLADMLTEKFVLVAPDGTVRDVTASLPATTFAAFGAGDRWLVQSYDGSSIIERVLDGNLAPVGVAHALPNEAAAAFRTYVVAGGGYFLVYWDGGALRVRATDGAFVDASPIAYSRYNHADPRAVYKDGTFQLVWGRGMDLYGSRIRASDGASLDPDDTFNQVSGARLLCHNCGGQRDVSRWQVTDTSGDVLVTWLQSLSDTHYQLVGARLDVATGTRRDGQTSSAEFTVRADVWDYELELKAPFGLLYSDNRIAAATYRTGPTPGVDLGTAAPVALSSKQRKDVAVAYGGSRFLVAWRVDNNFMGGYDLYASRVDPVTGAYVDQPALALGYARNAPVVVWTGTEFLVASLESDGLLGHIVHADGTLGADVGPFSVPFSHPTDYQSLQMVSNGDKTLAAWIDDDWDNGSRLVALRLDSSAQPMPEGAIVVKYYPLDFALMADSTPAPNRRTFVLAVSTPPNYDIVAIRLRSESGVVIDSTTSLARGLWLHGTSDGTSALLSYTDFAASGNAAGLLDPVEGTWTTGPVGFDWWPGATQHWFDGRSFQAIQGPPQGEYRAYRFDKALSPLDPTAPVGGVRVIRAGLNDDVYCTPAAASNGSGRSLIVDCESDENKLGVVLKGRWLDNDGEASSVGEGGAGGASDGGAGAATTGGTTSGGSTSGGGTNGGTTHSAGGSISRGGTSASSGGASSGGIANTQGGVENIGGEGTEGGVGGLTAAGGSSSSQGGSLSVGGTDAGAGGHEVSQTGGRANANGGRSSTGGAMNGGAGNAGSSNDDGDSSGCGCAIAPRETNSARVSVAGMALLAFLRRRRRMHKPSA